MRELNTNTGVPSFDLLPHMIANLIEDNKELTSKVEMLDKKLSILLDGKGNTEDIRMNVEEAQKYIPSHPAVQTIYGWTSKNMIPYHKVGKFIYFQKSEIDQWLNQEQYKSNDDLEKEAQEYVRNKRK